MTRCFVVVLCGAADRPYESFIICAPDNVNAKQLRQIIADRRGIPAKAQHWLEKSKCDTDNPVIWMKVDTRCHLPLPPGLQDSVRINQRNVLLKQQNVRLQAENRTLRQLVGKSLLQKTL